VPFPTHARETEEYPEIKLVRQQFSLFIHLSADYRRPSCWPIAGQ
jgi:hypothetical protein